MDEGSDQEVPRKELERHEVLFNGRFLTCSCADDRPYFNDDWVCELFVDALERTRTKHKFALLAWVVMPEHFHLLLIPRLPESPVDAVLNMLKSTSSRRAMARWRDTGGSAPSKFWLPGGGYDRNARGNRSGADLIRYIHENPVRRGLVAKATDWRWSSARWYAEREGPAMDDPRAWLRAEEARLTAMFGSLSEASRVVMERFG